MPCRDARAWRGGAMLAPPPPLNGWLLADIEPASLTRAGAHLSAGRTSPPRTPPERSNGPRSGPVLGSVSPGAKLGVVELYIAPMPSEARIA